MAIVGFFYNIYFYSVMVKYFKHIALLLLTLVMVGAFGLLMANQVWFMHTHIDGNGHIYHHAHPYDKTGDSKPFKQHNHTPHATAAIEQAQLLFFQEQATLQNLHLQCTTILWGDVDLTCPLQVTVVSHGRAPPIS